MRFYIKEPVENTVTLFRRAGYSFQENKGGEIIFVRVFGASGYPRFHLFAKERDKGIDVSIHYDVSKATYGKTSVRHQGEYENEGMLKEEAERIIRFVERKNVE